MPDTVLDLQTRINIAPITEGMNQAARSVSDTTAQMNRSFADLASTSRVSIHELSDVTMADLKASVDNVAAVVAESMASIAASVRRGTTESRESLVGLQQQFARTAGEAKITAAGIGSSWGALGSLFGEIAAITIGASLAESFAHSAVEMHKFAEETGLTVEQVQELQYVAGQLHVPFESLETTISRLGKNMLTAAEGNKNMATLFQRLGIDVKAFAQGLLSPIDVIEKLQEKLSGSEKAWLTNAIAMQVGGRGSREFALLLGLTVQQFEAMRKAAEQTGGVMSTELNQKIVEGEAAMNRFWWSIKGAAYPVLVELIPVLKLAAEGFSELIFYVKVAWQVISGLAEAVVALAVAMAAGAAAMVGQWDTAAKLGQKSVELLKDSWSGSIDRIIKENERAAQSAHALWADMGKSGEDSARRVQDAWNDAFVAVNKGMKSAPAELNAGFAAIHDVIKKLSGGIDISGIAGGSKSRLDEWRTQLEEMKAAGDAFHQASLEDERQFWEKILTTQKLSAEERKSVEVEVNRVRHELALQWYTNAQSVESEIAKAAQSGSRARMDALVTEQKFAILEWGQYSKQAIEASRKVMEESIAADHKIAESVQQTVEKQIAGTTAGSQSQISAITNAITVLKGMQDSLDAGKTPAGGAPEPSQPLAPTAQADAEIRINMRQTESAQIKKIIEALTAKLAEIYRSETTEYNEQALQRMRDSNETAEKSADIQISAVQKISAEQMKETDRSVQYGILSYKQRETINTQILANEQATTHAIINGKIQEIQAEELVTSQKIRDESLKQASIIGTEQAEENAQKAIEKSHEETEKRIQALQNKRLELDQQIAQKEMQLADQVANHQIQSAEKAANVVSSSFQNAFDKLVTTHTSFLNTMKQFWDQMVLGFAKMGVQIVAGWIKSLATQLLLTITNEAQQTAVKTAGAAQLSTLTILQTGQVINAQVAQTGAVVAGQAAQTAAATTGAATRAGVGLLEDIKSIGRAAAAAAAHAFKWVMEEVPYPANVVLAPAMAAAAFGGVMAFGAMASAEGGMMVGSDQPVFAHAGEMIVPKGITAGLLPLISASQMIGGFGQDEPDGIRPQTLPSTMSSGLKMLVAQLSVSGGMKELAVAARGMDVMHDSLAMIHAGEHVLPEGIASRYRDGAPGASSGSSSTSVVQNVHHHNEITLNANGVDPKDIFGMEDDFVNAINRAQRNNKLPSFPGGSHS